MGSAPEPCPRAPWRAPGGPSASHQSMSGWGQGTTLLGDPLDGISTRGTERTFFFLPDQDTAYSKFINTVCIPSEGGRSHKHVPVGDPWPQESHLRPGRGCQASPLLWVPRIEQGKAWRRLGTPSGNSGSAHLQEVLPLSRDTRFLHGQNR